LVADHMKAANVFGVACGADSGYGSTSFSKKENKGEPITSTVSGYFTGKCYSTASMQRRKRIPNCPTDGRFRAFRAEKARGMASLTSGRPPLRFRLTKAVFSFRPGSRAGTWRRFFSIQHKIPGRARDERKCTSQ